MREQTISVLGAFLLLLSLAGKASAASFVDITYDLLSTRLISEYSECAPGSRACTVLDLIGGSMKVRYTSNSASSMPILNGPATLQSIAVSAHALWGNTIYSPLTVTTADLNLSLISPVGGTLLPGGTLAFASAQMRVAGAHHCYGIPYFGTGLCIAFAATLTSIPGPLGPYTTTAAISFAAAPGPYGGAQSTRHTASGSIPVSAPSKFISDVFSIHFATGLRIVGREILREAEGHDPKVIPEPGTLLLLGVGTTGLALVGRATRRTRRG